MNYRIKYIKYKKKYIRLKSIYMKGGNLNSGGIATKIIKEDYDVLSFEQKINFHFIVRMINHIYVL